METTLPQTIATTTINPMSDQMRITASSLLLSLERPHLDINRKLRTPEDETKLSTMLHWISNVISSNTAAALSHDSSSGRLTLYLCSDSAHEASKNNATRLSDLMRKSLSGGNQSDQEDEYLAFVTDVCWERILNKVNHRVPRFPNVPRGADVSTMASVLETIIGLAEAWNAWRLRTGIPENSTQIMKMKQTLNHSQSFDTLKHCFEQVFRPLDDTEDHLQELRRLWRCCYALLKSDFFIDIFNSRWKRYSANETWFLCRVYRRIWRLYSYRRGADVLLHRGIPHLISIITQSGGTPDITVCWVPHESASTVHMDVHPDQLIFQIGQSRCWSHYSGDLSQDSQYTSEARNLWSRNETRTVHVHPMVSLVNFLYSSGIRVMENRIGTSRRPCDLCHYYTRSIRLWNFRCARSSGKFRVDWAIPRTLPVGGLLTRDDAERIIEEVRRYAESTAFDFLTPSWRYMGYYDHTL